MTDTILFQLTLISSFVIENMGYIINTYVKLLKMTRNRAVLWIKSFLINFYFLHTNIYVLILISFFIILLFIIINIILYNNLY